LKRYLAGTSRERLHSKALRLDRFAITRRA
jgi:hypothetical protein